jgi:hypothetical protein
LKENLDLCNEKLDTFEIHSKKYEQFTKFEMPHNPNCYLKYVLSLIVKTQIVDDRVKVSRTSFKAKEGKCHMRRLLRGPADDLQHKVEQ